ncbi:uncharacterized protein TM35_000361040 [Trypanosoma theileri]|uniref:Uncharacterized protein n=1 Tax=Trypanosoma theileri TaxID=67003 RepID=A0A1X0NKE8_9TRYP|nr:uncharacterized protein TM35_000361040 [Trypanosoma theileri]ORC85244.1 hypothetical protein TM35_000361040 [Trypanosoma theileri]
MISQVEARAVQLALRGFKTHLHGPVDIRIDNTTIINIMQKENTHSQLLVKKVNAIDRVLRSHGIRAKWSYVASAKNPADGKYKDKKVNPIVLAKGVQLAIGRTGSGLKGAFQHFNFVSS